MRCYAIKLGNGLYTSETGVPFNGGHMHEEIQDIGQILNANGYNAFHCGKWHVPGRNVRESFHTLYYGKRDIGAGGGEYYDSASTHAVIDFLTTYDGARAILSTNWLRQSARCV